MSMSKPEQPGSSPIWAEGITNFSGAVEQGYVSPDHAIAAIGQVSVRLIQEGSLQNFGVLQQFLREQRAFVQLTSQVFRREMMPRPDIVCVDAVTQQPRNRWLLVCLGGPAELEKYLRQHAMSHEINETILARDTGTLAVDKRLS